MEYFASSHTTISWCEVSRCVVIEWRGATLPLEELQQGVNKTLELIRLKRSQRMLVDASSAPPLAPAMGRLFGQEWVTQMRASGLTTLAVIPPRDIFALSTMDGLWRRWAKQAVSRQIVFFENQQAAQQWFSSP